MRYIDADKIEIRVPYGYNNDGEVLIPISAVNQSIARTPTEDVVPKSEVERLNKELDELAEEHSDLIVEKDQLFDIAKKQKIEIEALKIANEKMYAANKAQASEIFEEIEERLEQVANNGYAGYLSALAELKKKYTENCTTCKHIVSCEPNPFGICDEYEDDER